MCVEDCPSGYTDIGLTCTKLNFGKRGFSFKNLGNQISNAAQDAGRKISNTAQDAGNNIKNTVSDATNIYTKQAYPRGVGKPPHCSDDRENDSGLCYTKCNAGYHGVGPVNFFF